MTKKSLLIAIVVLVLFGGAAWVAFKFLPPAAPPPEQTGTGGPTPQFENKESPAPPATVIPPATSNRTFAVIGENGEVIRVNDFTKSAVQDKNNSGIKYLAGEDENGIIQNAPYVISSLEDDQSFTVSLFAQPIGKTRVRAEKDLISQLGITAQEMCRLRYVVLVPFDVSREYAGRNLGFSFCSGAAQLPQ